MWTFRAMTTDVRVETPGLARTAGRALAGDIAGLFAETERRFSRFREDSELAILNRATAPIVVSPELLELLLVAHDHRERTGGLFDPSIGGALIAAGYDRSFAPGALDRDARPAPVLSAERAQLEIDVPSRRVTRHGDVQIDFGGFLKGRTVDRAASLLPAPAAVDAGGDAVVRGGGPDGRGWLVDVEDPFDPAAALVTLRIRDRAVATSAPNRRHWRTGGGIAHHLIDPRTSAPADSDLAQVTIIAATAERADVMAKVIFLLGADEGARVVAAQPELGAVLVTRAHELRVVGDVEVADA